MLLIRMRRSYGINGAFSAAARARVAGRVVVVARSPVYACASRGVGGPLKREGRPAAGQ